MQKQILLSICIPTYNRSKALRGNLNELFKQVYDKGLPVEIIISDNNSLDNTREIVDEFIIRGMQIRYIRNSTNIGMDGNFAQCYKSAIGKYILVLGDDDYLIDGMLEKLLFKLVDQDYGLIHLNTRGGDEISDIVFCDSELFLKEVSYWITYITSNIVNKKYIENYCFDLYHGTFLTIVPLYLTATINSQKNLLVNERVFSDGKDVRSNGGYNFFQVFVENYLCIWENYVFDNKISLKLYLWIKKDIFKKYILYNAFNLLIKKNESNYDLKGAFSIIYRRYFGHLYFYYYFTFYALKVLIRKIVK
ncbi:glycosyltransferase family 2 protein [Aquirufa sp. HETE-83D]|uniref:Glycosyltransferase family 2 protein n=1 Tax=Aquirufa esocilacus TaxID=3096513 RepID=A0ABW6DM91_9BACT